MNNYIVFNTEVEAVSAVETCWIKYIKDKTVVGYTAVNGDEYADVNSLTDTQILVLRLYGKNSKGIDEKIKGITINYGQVTKAYQQNKWFFSEPPAEYLALLSGYTIKTGQQLIDDGYYPPLI